LDLHIYCAFVLFHYQIMQTKHASPSRAYNETHQE